MKIVTFTLTWKRQIDGSYTAGAYTLRKEPTTFAYPRGAANAMWHVYVEGQDRHLSRKHLLVDAKSSAAQHVTRLAKEA